MRACGSLATVPYPSVAVGFGAAQARAQDTLVYSPLAALFGVLRGVGTSTARNRFDEVLSIRAFEVLDSLLEQLAQDHTQSKYTSSAISVTRLNLGSLRAVILMVRRPSLPLRDPPSCTLMCVHVGAGGSWRGYYVAPEPWRRWLT